MQGTGSSTIRKPQSHGPHPQLQRHGIAGFAEFDLRQGRHAIGLEAAKGIGQTQTQAAIDLRGDELVDAAAVGRRLAVAGKLPQVAAAGNDVDVPARNNVSTNFGINCGWCWPSQSIVDQHVVAAADGEIERRPQCGAIAPIRRMA